MMDRPTYDRYVLKNMNPLAHENYLRKKYNEYRKENATATKD